MNEAGIIKQSDDHELASRSKRARSFEQLLRWLVITMVAVGIAAPGWAQLSHWRNELLHQDLPGMNDDGEANDWFGAAVVFGDFNDDGYLDMAVGIPYEDIGAAANAGAVQVLYGAESGIGGGGNVFLNQGTSDDAIQGVAEAGDMFGSCLAVGDFNSDGFDDLVVGVPGEDINTLGVNYLEAGAIHVFYGGEGSLSDDDVIWHQDDTDIPGACEDNDRFGSSLAVGRFNDDGYDDLAIGVPGEDVVNNSVDDGGLVLIMYGGDDKLTATGSRNITENTSGISGNPEDDDYFGYALASDDFNGDGFDDLAVGIPGQDFIPLVDVGQVLVLYGPLDEDPITHDYWYKDKPGIEDDAESGDGFGHTLASGDFDGDDYADLAIGVPDDNQGGVAGCGTVHVLYGSDSVGLTAAGNDFWYQGAGIPESKEEDDAFGWSLAAGDFDNNGYDDLAVGVQQEDLAAGVAAGSVIALYGSVNGLSTTGAQLWNQNADRVVDEPATLERFGYAVAAGDVDGDGYDDLAVGVPGEREGTTSIEAIGAVHLLYGATLRYLQVNEEEDPPFDLGIDGTVTSVPMGIECGEFCSDWFPEGTVVTLTPTPAANVKFVEWQGAGCESGVVTLVQNMSCTAVFAWDADCALSSREFMPGYPSELAELYQPFDGAADVSVRPFIEWQCISSLFDPTYQPAYYRVRINTGEVNTDFYYTTVCETTETSCVSDIDLAPNTEYSVHVYAYDEMENIFGDSVYHSFTTGGGGLIFTDGFERGDLTKWSSVVE